MASPRISIVAPVFNEEETLPEFYRRVQAVMEGLGESWELVLVDDGSADGSFAICRDLHQQDSRVRVVRLARNFGHQIAITAGMDHARGDAVVTIDSDLQDPPEVIPELVARWREGYHIVYGVRSEREGETWFKLFTARLFYRLIAALTDIRIPMEAGDFRLLDRRVVEEMRRMREHRRFIRGMTCWVGYRQIGVPYHRHARFAGQTKYPFRKMLRLALDAITGFSDLPLRLAWTFGAILLVLGVLLGLILLILRLTGQAPLAGQGVVLTVALILSGTQLLFLGVMGEYLARIYDEVRNRPLYVVWEILE
ncbi:MAG: glycosyltransferase family 2 protein [Anaerolineae bacterium]|nr:glycosyltransferase family 2 protein [Anaerolineae bacterium]MDW8068947.1 glycosyltransferase family 2 protein [Anaerolineae bacterium]